MAEGILREKIRRYGLDWEVDSAGTGSWHIGEAPDARAVLAMRLHGTDISDLRARQFRAGDFDRFDLILTMDQSNYREVMDLARNDKDREKVKLLLDIPYPGKHRSVPDPYWDDDGFEQVYQLLDIATNALIEQHAPSALRKNRT